MDASSFSPSGAFDQFSERDRLNAGSILQESVEEFPPMLGSPTIESERELIKIVVQVFMADRPLVRAQKPSLQQRRNPVAAGQKILTQFRFATHNFVGLTKGAQSAVSAPPVRPNHALVRSRFSYGMLQTLPGRIGNTPQANSPDIFAVDLGCDHHQSLSGSSSPSFPGFFAANVGFIHLNGSSQTVSRGSNHGSTKFVEP